MSFGTALPQVFVTIRTSRDARLVASFGGSSSSSSSGALEPVQSGKT